MIVETQKTVTNLGGGLALAHLAPYKRRLVDLGCRWFWVSYDGGKRWKTGRKMSSDVTRRGKNCRVRCVAPSLCAYASYGKSAYTTTIGNLPNDR